jgi:hypothetical protein
MSTVLGAQTQIVSKKEGSHLKRNSLESFRGLKYSAGSGSKENKNLNAVSPENLFQNLSADF